MNSKNTIVLIGRLGRDAEQKYLQSGDSVVNFSMAINAWYKKDGEKIEKTEWVDVAVWGKLGEALLQYLTKGKEVQIKANFLSARAYIGQDGEARATIKVTADDINLMGSGDGNGQRNTNPADTASDDDEHPF